MPSHLMYELLKWNETKYSQNYITSVKVTTHHIGIYELRLGDKSEWTVTYKKVVNK